MQDAVDLVSLSPSMLWETLLAASTLPGFMVWSPDAAAPASTTSAAEEEGGATTTDREDGTLPGCFRSEAQADAGAAATTCASSSPSDLSLLAQGRPAAPARLPPLLPMPWDDALVCIQVRVDRVWG